MLSCPICDSQIDDVSAHDGRCPNCGGVIAWHYEEETAAEPAEDLVHDPVHNADSPKATAKPSKGSVAPQRPPAKSAMPKPESLSDSRRVDVTAMWEGSISPDSGNYSTLGQSMPASDEDSDLVIQSRKLSWTDDADVARADYELLEVIGEGGVGVVYSARQASIDRTVAVKMLRAETTPRSEEWQKFVAEAVVTGDLDHPNIVPIYDLASNESGALFYSMKRVQGTPWLDVITSKTQVENLLILMKVIDAISLAHSRGVVHRDLKPENVMLGGFGEVLVMDWGIALSTSLTIKDGSIGQSSSMGGTPAYMAPEMVTGPLEEIGPSSDIYLLGAILYEIITHVPPHTGGDVMQCLLAAAQNEIQPTEKTGELLDIALKAMATRIEDRYATVQEFQQAITTYQSHSESIVLTEQAGKDLQLACQTNENDDYARSVFGYQEAVALWDQNDAAIVGLSEARLAYARSALTKGDFDLGLSQLDDTNPDHESVGRELLAGQRERDARQRRLRMFQLGVASLAVVIVVGSVIVGVILNNAKNDAVLARNKEKELKDDAVKLQVKADGLAADAVKKERVAEGLRKDAETAKGLAQGAEAIAVDAKEKAVTSADEARQALQKQLEHAYTSHVSLAAAKVDEFAIGNALAQLEQYRDGEDVARFRHWEWGRLMHLCKLPTFALSADRQVESLDVSSDGKWALVGNSQGTAQLWNLSSGQRELQVTHGQAVLAVAFTPDGRHFATAGDSAIIKLWNIESLQAGHTESTNIEEHSGPIQSLDFSRSGSQLVSASSDKSALVWSVKWDNSPIVTLSHELRHHGGAVWDARFSDNGTQVVTAGDDRLVIIWKIDESAPKSPKPNTPQKIFFGHDSPVYAATFSPDGVRVASVGRDEKVFLWRPEEQEEFDYDNLVKPALNAVVLSGHTAAIRDVQFAGSTGDVVVTAGDDNTIRIWDVRDPSDEKKSSALRLQLRQRAGFKEPVVTVENNSTSRPDEKPAPVSIPAEERLLQVLRGHGGWVHAARLPADATMIVSAGYDTEDPVKVWRPLQYAEQRVLREHTGGVSHAQFSPSGKYLVTTGADHVSRIWDYRSGTQLGLFDEGHEFMTMRAQIGSGATPRLVSVGADNTLRIWDADRGGQLNALSGTGTSGALAISHSGELILSGGPDMSALLIRASDGTIVQKLEGHLAAISAVGFSPDDTQLVTCDREGRGRIWNWAQAGETWQFQHELVGHGAGREITAVNFFSDGMRLITASADNTLVLWDAMTGEELDGGTISHQDAVTSMALSPDGRQVVTVTAFGERKKQATDEEENQPGGRDQKLWLWDTESGKIVDSHTVTGEYITHVEFSPEGDTVLVAASDTISTDNYVRQWLPAEGTYGPFWKTAGERGSIWSASYTPAGFTPSGIITAGGTRIRIWDKDSGKQLREYGRDSDVTSASFSLDERYVATTGSNGSVKIWDRQDKYVVRRLNDPHDGKPVSFARFLPTAAGRIRLLTAGEDNVSRIWEMDENLEEADGEIEIDQFVLPDTGASDSVSRVAAMNVSPDGTRLIVVASDGNVHIWDIASHKLEEQFQLQADGVTCVALAPGGQGIIVGNTDNTASVWTAANEQWSLLLSLQGHSAPLTSVAFSPDGRRALTTSRDGTAKIWAQSDDPTSNDGVEMLTLKGHDSEVTTGQFSPDGRYIVTGNGDRSGTDTGVAIVWLTHLIHPSLDAVSQAIEMDATSLVAPVMPEVTVREPMRARFANAKLTIELVKPANDAYQGPLAIDIAGLEAPRRTISVATDRRPDLLTIELDERATRDEIETILRTLTIGRVAAAVGSPINKEGTVEVRTQLSGTDASETTWSTQTSVTVRILPIIPAVTEETVVVIQTTNGV